MIEKDLERIANALDKIALALETSAGRGNTEVTCTMPAMVGPVSAQVGVQDPPGTATGSSQEDKDAEHLKREMLKKELRDKGVKFSASAKTETLQKLLDAAPAVAAETKVEEPGNTQSEGPKTETAPVATKAEALDLLVKISGHVKLGKTKALDILKTQGKAEKLSNVDPSRYKLIIDTCKVALAQAGV